tara:strand:- start:62 stop:565 length:504 start_codon:yes stop_codon:yes gene_type:complete
MSDEPLIAVIMGSESDFEVMNKAIECLKQLKVPIEVDIVSAHRTPEKMFEYAGSLFIRNFAAVIAGAGGAAHLPGMVASLTILPVIGVPISSTKMDGLDSLYSIVQMPAGIPVATVAIDNAENAAILAVQILLRAHPQFVDNLERFRLDRKNKVLNSSKKRKFIFSP